MDEKEKELKISIITVSKNSERFIAETIESVVGQTYNNIQYIIVDGSSTDSSLEIIKYYNNQIDIVLSELDEGMYDAINKGLKLATGDYILVLNSDDVLVSKDIIKNIVKKIRRKKYDYYYGNLIKSKNGKYKKVRLFPTSFEMLFYSTHCTFVHHSCFFVSAKLNLLLGGYNTRYKFASDYDYILRAMAMKDMKGKYLNLYITKFRIHDSSISASGRITPERKQILKEHGYYKKPLLLRKSFYYLVWIYYKIRNIGQKFKIGIKQS